MMIAIPNEKYLSRKKRCTTTRPLNSTSRIRKLHKECLLRLQHNHTQRLRENMRIQYFRMLLLKANNILVIDTEVASRRLQHTPHIHKMTKTNPRPRCLRETKSTL
ncbi:hypothetical protein FGSG_12022 [Fusarium graminearum PH-1]|uniref:hypothetical protein n=1 Tax=Gibberella zeae (strain ATCC MYA-4620 / CBS 123657 / FGSC 9075 / NRRL 31084 / PH-1) TaxID=229533 RepID=UPI00021F235C|nr:hypothetical protein FGSG_12022 [Fusarium graminearum PH-1]ESU07219.1 hypothetical protein FGSG_12022 [Fusarium graminearum PH-1]|eukprot:XP_011317704.1 hypothetical protein FGSG_12022 [Fusarium graminearum PH-1]